MKGFGSYNDWTYYASPSSNLSAFATPFSVNRSSPNDVSAPFIDPGDSSRPGFPYRYPGPIKEKDSDSGYPGLYGFDSCSQLPHQGQFFNGTKPSTLVEPQQYFNSYGVHQDHSNSGSVVPDHWSSFSGFTASDGVSRADYVNKPNELGFAGQSVANQFADFGNGKGNQIGVGGGFGLNQTNFTGSVADERMKSGCQDVIDSHGKVPHMIGWEKNSLTISVDPVDDKSFWWRTPKLGNAGCQDITDSRGEVPHMIGWEKHSLPASGDCVDDKSCWWRSTKPMPVDFSHTSVLQSPPLSVETHHEAPLKLAVDSGDHHFPYTGVYDKHFGQQDKLKRVDTVSSTSITGSGTDLNLGNFVPDGGVKKFCDLKETACFGLNLRTNLYCNEPSSSNNAMISDMNDSGDVVDRTDKARHEFQYLQPNPGLLSLGLDAIQGVSSVDKSFDCVGDLCNPSVDSPCWKGAPAAYFSYYESSEALPPKHVPKNECFGSVIQEPQSFLLDGKNNVKKPCDSSSQMHIQIADQATYSMGSSWKQNSETRFASDDCNVVSAGPFHSETCCELQYQDDTKMKDNSVPPTKPVDCESGSSHDEDQVTEEKKLGSQKPHTLCSGGADAGCNEDICSASGTSLTGGCALSLSSSVEDASTTPEKSAGKVSTEELNTQMLVDTMNKFSQLLLNRCFNNACELEEQNCNILRDVITNLNTCVLKNAERINLAQECLLRQPETSRCAVESCELQQGVQITKIGPESSVDELENQPAQKADLCFGSEKPSDFISPSGGAKMTKEENMTKAIKNILSENFDDDEATESQTLLYKNLWLEAEAALCSVSYKTRYNQMKIEMEKKSYKQRDMEEHSKFEVIPSLSRSKSSTIEVNRCPNSDSSAQDLADLAATIPMELSQLKFSSDMDSSLTPEADGGQNLYNFIQNYAVSGTNKEVVENDEASVMARYNVIKSRADKSSINANDLETPSDIAGVFAPQEADNQNQVNLCQDFPVPGKNEADYETSVLARFHFLKSRDAEDSCSVSSTEKLFEFSGEEIKDTVITKDALRGESLDANLNSYTALDTSILKEIHLALEDSQEVEHCRTYEFLPPNYHFDGLASDWEHV